MGNDTIKEELCLVDSAITNTILRETKYIQTLTKRKEDVTTITGSNKAIIGSGRATFTLPMGTTIVIQNALLYPESRHTLISFKDIRSNNFHLKTVKMDNKEYLLLTKSDIYEEQTLENSLHFLPDYTLHTSNPYLMLRTK
jgi:hypothetical protein